MLRKYSWLFLLVVLLISACAKQSVPPSLGKLVIEIIGLPEGVNANVEVTSNQGFSETLTAGKTLSDLSNGEYRIEARAVLNQDVNYMAFVVSETLSIQAGQTLNHTITYSPNSNFTTVSGKLIIPEGMNIKTTDLTIVNSLVERNINAQGEFQTAIFKDDRQLSIVLGENDQPIFLTWLGDGHSEIGVRSTAEVYLYIAMGGFALPQSVHTTLIELIDETPELAELVTSLENGLIRNPNYLVDGSDEIIEKVKGVLSTYKTELAQVITTQSILVDGKTQQSGIALDLNVGPNSIQLQNSFRRRSRVFIQQTAYIDDEGNRQTLEKEEKLIDLNPVTGVGSVIDSIEKIVLNDLPYSPVKTDVMFLPIEPADAKSAIYKITAVGFGFNQYDGKLSLNQESELYKVAIEQAVFDFTIPFIANVVGGVKFKGEDIAEDIAETLSKNGALKNLIEDLEANSNGLAAKISNGDFTFISDVFNTIITNPKNLEALISIIVNSLDDKLKDGLSDASISKIESALKAIRVVNLITATTDLGVMANDLRRSELANFWELTVNPFDINLEPNGGTLEFDEELEITASIPGEKVDNNLLEFRWKLEGQSDSQPVGRIFGDELQKPTIRYKSLFSNGEDKISVEVWIKTGEGKLSQIGESDPITIKVEDEITVQINIPSDLVALKESLTGEDAITATLLGDEPKGEIVYQWTTTGEFGSLSTGRPNEIGKLVVTKQPLVNYLAGDTKEGTDVVTVEAFQTLDGKQVSLGKSSGRVTVEDLGTITVTPKESSKTLFVTETDSLSLNITTERTLAAKYRATVQQNQGSGISIASGETGSVSNAKPAELKIALQCPSEAGTYTANVDFEYSREDDTVFQPNTGEFTRRVTVKLDCEEPIVILSPKSITMSAQEGSTATGRTAIRNGLDVAINSPAGVIAAKSSKVHTTRYQCGSPGTYTSNIPLSFSTVEAGPPIPNQILNRTITCTEREPDPESCEDLNDTTKPDIEEIGADGSGGRCADPRPPARGWGDPRIVSYDSFQYDFHAVGDYVLSKSNRQDTNFEVQIRYRPFTQFSEKVSFNEAAAMQVLNDHLEIYATFALRPRILLNGSDLDTSKNINMVLPSGGRLTMTERNTTVSWPNGRSVSIGHRTEHFGSIDIIPVVADGNRLVGLMGNSDNDPSNDLKFANGTTLPAPLDQKDLYLNYRSDWRVPFGSANSLFSVGPERFDPSYPEGIISITDLDPDKVDTAREQCEDGGVLNSIVLEGCIIDVVITDDTSWIPVAFETDPNVLKVRPTPSAITLFTGERYNFNATVTGTTNRAVNWSATVGTIDASGLYTAPATAGQYEITTVLASDASIRGSAIVTVIDGGGVGDGPCAGLGENCIYWTGDGDGSSWNDANNWDRDSLPTQADRVIIDVPNENATVDIDLAATAAPILINRLELTESLNIISGNLFIEGISTIDGTLALNAGILKIGDTMTINGALNWSAGDVGGTGIYLNKGRVTLNGGRNKSTNSEGFRLDNEAMLILDGTGQLMHFGPAIINNNSSGVIDLKNDVDLPRNTLELNNQGLFKKSGGTAEALWRSTFNNTNGTLDISSGEMTFVVGGGNLTNGSYNIANGATLSLNQTFSDAQWKLSGTLSGRIEGTFQTKDVGSRNADTILSVPSGETAIMDFESGIFNFSNAFFSSDISTTLNSTASLIFRSPVALSGIAINNDAGKIINESTMTWIAGGLSVSGNSELINTPNGLFVASTRGSLVSVNDGLFKNQGTFLVDLDNDTDDVIIGLIENTGLIEVRKGNALIRPPSQMLDGSTYTVAKDAKLEFSGATFSTLITFKGTHVSSIEGELVLNSKILIPVNETAVFDFTDTGLTWLSQGIFGPGRLTNKGSITVTAGNKSFNDQLKFDNEGDFIWQDSSITSSQTGVEFNNQIGGLFEIQTQTPNSIAFQEFNNYGHLKKVVNSNEVTFIGRFINNGGTLSLNSHTPINIWGTASVVLLDTIHDSSGGAGFQVLGNIFGHGTIDLSGFHQGTHLVMGASQLARLNFLTEDKTLDIDIKGAHDTLLHFTTVLGNPFPFDISRIFNSRNIDLSELSLDNRTVRVKNFELGGHIIWKGNSPDNLENVTINNGGTFEIQADGVLNLHEFRNDSNGIIRKTAGNGNTTINACFVRPPLSTGNGIIEESGTITINNTCP